MLILIFCTYCRPGINSSQTHTYPQITLRGLNCKFFFFFLVTESLKMYFKRYTWNYWVLSPCFSSCTSLQRIWMCLQASLRCSKLNKSPREIWGVPPMCSMYQILPLLSPSHAVPFIYAFLQLRGNSIFSHLEDSLFCVAVPLGSGML